MLEQPQVLAPLKWLRYLMIHGIQTQFASSPDIVVYCQLTYPQNMFDLI